MQASSFSDVTAASALEYTFHHPTELNNEHSCHELSDNTDEEGQHGGNLASENDDSDDPSDYSKRRKLGAALYTIHLQERHMLTNTAVEFVEERTTSLIRWSLLNVKGEVLNALQNSGLHTDNLVPMIEQIFESEMNPFEGIDSTWLKEQFIKQHFPYVVSTFMFINAGRE